VPGGPPPPLALQCSSLQEHIAQKLDLSIYPWDRNREPLNTKSYSVVCGSGEQIIQPPYSASLTLVPRDLVRSGGFTTQHRQGEEHFRKGTATATATIRDSEKANYRTGTRSSSMVTRCRLARPKVLSSKQVRLRQPALLYSCRHGSRVEAPTKSRQDLAKELSDHPLAASGPHLPSPSLAAFARHHLGQEPHAGNPLAWIGARVRSNLLPRLSLASLSSSS
jgi:hypothetical protein